MEPVNPAADPGSILQIKIRLGGSARWSGADQASSGPEPCDELARLGADSGGIDRGRGHVGVSQNCGDRCQRDSGLHGGDTVAVPQSSGARLGVEAAIDRRDMDIEGPGDFADGFPFFNEILSEGYAGPGAVWAGGRRGRRVPAQRVVLPRFGRRSASARTPRCPRRR